VIPGRPGACAAAALLALAAGCGLMPHAPVPEVQEGAWPEARDHETRFADIYDGFEHRADLWTIRLTPKVREERARRIAAWLSWTPAELEEKLAAERAEVAKWDDFIVFLYTSKPRWNDLDATDSIWRLEFDLGGGEVVAAQAQAQVRNATFEALFPMGGAFDTAYRLRFARTDDGTGDPLPGVLRMASAVGEMIVPYTPTSKPHPAPRPVD
jgi:hypothetical protein